VKLRVDWNEPLIRQQDVLRIRTEDLDVFYAQADDADKVNLFFVLLNSQHACAAHTQRCQAAHLSFLLAYYVFALLSPPGADALAYHYIEQAMQLNPLEEYAEWIPLIQETDRA
jgi:hypothetical protein